MALIRKLLPYLVTLAGVLVAVNGVRMVYEPAAWVLCGLALAAAGLVRDWERGSQ